MDASMRLRSRDLGERLDTIGWGLLCLLIATLAMPSGPTEFVGVAVVGGLMVGLNVVRRLVGIDVRWFTVILGSVAVAAGVGALVGIPIDAFVLFFAVLGVVLVGRAVLRDQ